MPEINNSSQIEWSESNGDLTATIVSGSVTATELASNSVDTAELVDGAVTEAKIDSGAVTVNKIGSGAVTEAKIGSGAVTEAKIGTGAITTAKIGDTQVTNAKLSTGIDATKIADGTVSNTEFQYLNGLSNDIQSQLNQKVNTTGNSTINNGLLTINGSLSGLALENNTAKIQQSNDALTYLLFSSGTLKFVSDNDLTLEINDSNFKTYSRENLFASLPITYFYSDYSTTNNLVAAVYTNGDIKNDTGVYGTLSDARVKTDITSASSQWNDIKSLNVVNYRLQKHVDGLGDEAPRMLGVVAQELEDAGMHGLVSENQPDENGVAYKSVKYSILYMKAVKALQEAMGRIEILESKVEALGA